ncbi:MAG TPA: SdpA family antimicrobial peptide system protein [Saprospiraceae bacterium]|nr:SdpA family antimicrobial peptide system protein [Saprospiraceae bacterium]
MKIYNWKVIGYFCALTAGFAFLFFFLLVTSVPENPVKIRSSFFQKSHVNYFLPQGWGFFTRDPQEERKYLVKMDENGNLVSKEIRNTSAGMLFGLSRENRIVNSKIGLIYDKLITKKIQPVECEGSIEEFIRKNGKQLTRATMQVADFGFCGEYYLISQKPLPWSWIALKDNFEMPSKIFKINLECN